MNNEFLPWSKIQHQAHPRTYERYKVASKPLIAAFGKTRVDAITSAQVEKFKLTRSEEISPAGTNRDLAALRSMLNLTIRRGYIARNPVVGVRFLPEGPGSHANRFSRRAAEVLGRGKRSSSRCRDFDGGNWDATGRGVHDPQRRTCT